MTIPTDSLHKLFVVGLAGMLVWFAGILATGDHTISEKAEVAKARIQELNSEVRPLLRKVLSKVAQTTRTPEEEAQLAVDKERINGLLEQIAVLQVDLHNASSARLTIITSFYWQCMALILLGSTVVALSVVLWFREDRLNNQLQELQCKKVAAETSLLEVQTAKTIIEASLQILSRKKAERAGAANPHAFGTSGISPAEQARMPEASGDT